MAEGLWAGRFLGSHHVGGRDRGELDEHDLHADQRADGGELLGLYRAAGGYGGTGGGVEAKGVKMSIQEMNAVHPHTAQGDARPLLDLGLWSFSFDVMHDFCWQ